MAGGSCKLQLASTVTVEDLSCFFLLKTNYFLQFVGLFESREWDRHRLFWSRLQQSVYVTPHRRVGNWVRFLTAIWYQIYLAVRGQLFGTFWYREPRYVTESACRTVRGRQCTEQSTSINQLHLACFARLSDPLECASDSFRGRLGSYSGTS